MAPPEYFLKPTALERLLNKSIGLLARAGFGPAYMHLLRVRGRKTGKNYDTPINLLQIAGHYYLVGGRGHTAWSKNAETMGEVTLVRGRNRKPYRVRALSIDEKLPILKAYLGEYRNTVQRFFAVPADAPVEAFRSIADQHPAFELMPLIHP